MKLIKKGLVWNILFITFFFVLISDLHLAIAQSGQHPPQHVLIVHSAYQGYPWTDSLNVGIHDVFDSSPVPVDLMFEYIDIKRNRDLYYFEQLRELWKIKYDKLPVDLIIVCDNEAYDFVLQERDNLFRGIPIVFTGYNGYTPDMLDDKQPITGVIEEIDIAATIDVALLLHPQTEKIVFVAPGAPPFRMVWLEGLEQKYAKKAQLLTITAENIDQIDREIDSHGTDIVVIPLNSFKESNGAYFPFTQFVSHLAMERPFPVYALWDIAIGHGVVGGKMVTGTSQGRRASQQALQILQGTPISDVPVVTKSPNQYMFDWDAMQRFKISESDLPEKAIVINRPASFYDENKTIVHVSLVSVFALLVLIFSLVVAVIHLRRTKINLLLSDKILKESEAQFRKMIEKSPLPMVITDQVQNIRFFNDKFTELFGYTLEDVSTADEWWSSGYPDLEYREKVQNSWLIAKEKASATGTDIEMQEWALTIKNGTQRECEFYMVPLQDQSLIIMNDISERKKLEVERKKLELRLHQSQKMESIGNLAGGIAHEFNNMLAIIMGNNELIMDELPEGSLAKESTEEIQVAGLRARDVVKQLLTFSRKDDAVKKVMDFTSVVQESMKLIRSSTPTNIKIDQNLSADTYLVMGNDTQINQLLINLCNNAVDALPEEGGILTIELLNETIDIQQIKHQTKLNPGQYAKLIVSDNGIGMDTEILGRVFDPYFTTKDIGQGTGIGMAIVHGIVESHGGAIIVYSEPGQGTTFTIFLPAHEGLLEQETDEQNILPVGDEYILYVDDEPSIAKLGKRLLDGLGYTTESTTDPENALDMMRKDPNKFDLLITDMAMPNMTGEQLVIETLKIRQNMPIIICTGYSAKISEKDAGDIGARSFIMKPITKFELATTVRKVLDSV